jgi:hypothetical protein
MKAEVFNIKGQSTGRSIELARGSLRHRAK